VVIKTSSSRQVAALVADLASPRELAREAAVARLAVIGARAVERVSAVAHDTQITAAARTAALRVLGAIGDARALQAAFDALNAADEAVAIAAVAVAGLHLRGPQGTAAVDHLTALALDRSRTARVRAAAVRALQDLEASTIAPLIKRLRSDTSREVRAVVDPESASPRDAARLLDAAADGLLPDDPEEVRRAIIQAGRRASLPLLQRLVDRLRHHERHQTAELRARWTTARAAAHAALAARGSRVALYDLRETLETAEAPLPVALLTAVTAIGDASCLEAMAVAFARAGHRGDADWWRQHLADAFRAVAARERITRRHVVMKKILKRWPEIVGASGRR
jgi:hypothetical protein